MLGNKVLSFEFSEDFSLVYNVILSVKLFVCYWSYFLFTKQIMTSSMQSCSFCVCVGGGGEKKKQRVPNTLIIFSKEIWILCDIISCR